MSKEKNYRIHTDYLKKVYDINKFSLLVKTAIKSIRTFKKKNEFDAIAFTGTSGAALAYPISASLKIPLICVRKDDGNHFEEEIEGCITATNYIVIDDFISTGKTMRRVRASITNKIPKSNLIGIFLYAQSWKHTWNKIPVYSF